MTLPGYRCVYWSLCRFTRHTLTLLMFLIMIKNIWTYSLFTWTSRLKLASGSGSFHDAGPASARHWPNAWCLLGLTLTWGIAGVILIGPDAHFVIIIPDECGHGATWPVVIQITVVAGSVNITVLTRLVVPISHSGTGSDALSRVCNWNRFWQIYKKYISPLERYSIRHLY